MCFNLVISISGHMNWVNAKTGATQDDNLQRLQYVISKLLRSAKTSNFKNIPYVWIEVIPFDTIKTIPSETVVTTSSERGYGYYCSGLSNGSKARVLHFKVQGLTAEFLTDSFHQHCKVLRRMSCVIRKAFCVNFRMERYIGKVVRACHLVMNTSSHCCMCTLYGSRNTVSERTLNASITESLSIDIDRYITWQDNAGAYRIYETILSKHGKVTKRLLGMSNGIQDVQTFVLANSRVSQCMQERLIDEWITKVHEDAFERLAIKFWDWRMIISPEFSTTIPMSKYNDKLNSYCYEKFKNEWKAAKRFLQQLSLIDKNKIADVKKISYDILKNMLDVFVAGYKWKDYQPLNPINFLEGWFVNMDYFVSCTPFDTQGDFHNYIQRIELIPQQLEEMMDLSRRAIENGHTNHAVSVSRVPEQINSILVDDPALSALYKPFWESAGVVFLGNPDALRSADERLKLAINGFVTKAKELREFLINEYMPMTRQGLGMCSLPGGTENYEACLYFHTSINITAEQVHQQGLEEVARIAGLIRSKMNILGYPAETTISQMYQSLLCDKRFILQNPDDIIKGYREMIFNRIQPLIPKFFNNVPMLPLEVRPSHCDGLIGEHKIGTADGTRPGIFYVNVSRPEYNPTCVVAPLSLHEAFPGHHLAESFGLVADIPEFRKKYELLCYNAPCCFPCYTAFVEGWALYSEYLGEEMGIYQDDYDFLGRYSDEMLRACRLVIDTGIHHFNWTREQSIGYLLRYTALTREYVEIEIDRYVTWPGQAIGYKIGELKIRELRTKATQALGDKFDIGEFHYTILRHGTMPLNVLEYIVDYWIKAQLGRGHITQSPN